MEDQPEKKERFNEIKGAMTRNPSEGVGKIWKYLDELNNAPLNIAITGESGSGKSSFVNAFRGINNNDEGAAKVDCFETTMEGKAYPHPNHPNVKLWDLPGVGTTKFPADEYLKKVGFEKFDLFIIISATRFRENDAKLAKDIQKMEKNFYFVRSKIDNDLCNAKRDSVGDFDENTILALIRDNCIKGLQEQGIEAPKVFLMSSHELHLFDFSQLQETLEKELPEHKRVALLWAMPSINLEIIEKKRKAFEDQIKWLAALSSAAAAVPVPGVSQFVDANLLGTAVKQYINGFGLDKPSLERLSSVSGVSLHDLQAVIQSHLRRGNITRDLIMECLQQMRNLMATMAAEEGSRWIPVIGILVAMVLSYTGTYLALKAFLQILAEDAQRVFRKALGLNTSV